MGEGEERRHFEKVCKLSNKTFYLITKRYTQVETASNERREVNCEETT